MNYATAICGHLVPAVGAPGSIARTVAETTPCDDCLIREAEDLVSVVEPFVTEAFLRARDSTPTPSAEQPPVKTEGAE